MVAKLAEWAELVIFAIIIVRFIAMISGTGTDDFFERTEEAADKALSVIPGAW